MDTKQVEQAITAAFGSNVAGFEKAMVRLAKQDQMAGLQSQLRNLNDKANKVASRYVADQAALSAQISALQAEIDGLEIGQ